MYQTSTDIITGEFVRIEDHFQQIHPSVAYINQCVQINLAPFEL